jgi:aspartate-semialdehyde dehydrogenase
MSYAVAVGGATGNVGQEMVRTLEQRNFPVASFVPLASAASVAAGRSVRFKGEDVPVQDLANFDFSHTDFLFLSTGAANSRERSPRAAAAGCIVIDNSSAFRMAPDVPLVVPEVNAAELDRPEWRATGILPVANCSTIQMVVALKPLHDAAGIRRIVVSTYQAASGGGRKVLDRLHAEIQAGAADIQTLENQSNAASVLATDKPIAFNVVPHIDVFLDDGRTKEEWKMEVETRRILGLPHLAVSATCVRVPVTVGHAEAINVEFERPMEAKRAREILRTAPGVVVVDEPRLGGYATQLDAAGQDAVYVSRIRNDSSAPNCINLWVVADNVRKGAALNAVQMAESLIARGTTPPRGHTSNS